MGLIKYVTDVFNGTARPSERQVRRLVGRTKTREGRMEHLEFLAQYPEHINATDKNHKSALSHAAAEGDTEVMGKLIKLGIMPYFYHDAIYAAAHNEQKAALDLLVAAGGVVGEDHIDVTCNMAIVYGEPGPEGEPSPTEDYSQKLYRGLEMLKSIRKAQEEKRAVDAENAKIPGPLVLADNISVRKPLKLKLSSRMFMPL
ncbi:MAG: ankyrin repeat domain-containing protein [Alphaproteobacteria bacterium]|nr:MAG: ankyrin repeat domain-containing protein [Alphaproteobacteria bacterium]